jgi:hypothetical protein
LINLPVEPENETAGELSIGSLAVCVNVIIPPVAETAPEPAVQPSTPVLNE